MRTFPTRRNRSTAHHVIQRRSRGWVSAFRRSSLQPQRASEHAWLDGPHPRSGRSWQRRRRSASMHPTRLLLCRPCAASHLQPCVRWRRSSRRRVSRCCACARRLIPGPGRHIGRSRDRHQADCHDCECCDCAFIFISSGRRAEPTSCTSWSRSGVKRASWSCQAFVEDRTGGWSHRRAGL